MATIAEVRDAFVFSLKFRARRTVWPEGVYIAPRYMGAAINGIPMTRIVIVDENNTEALSTDTDSHKLLAAGLLFDDWIIDGETSYKEHEFYETRKIKDALRYCELQHSQGAVCAAVLRMLRGKANPALVNEIVSGARVDFKNERYPNQPWIIDKLVFEAAEVHDHVKRELLLAGFDPSEVAANYRELAEYSDTFTGWLLACDTAVAAGIVKPLPADYIEAAVAKAPKAPDAAEAPTTEPTTETTEE